VTNPWKGYEFSNSSSFFDIPGAHPYPKFPGVPNYCQDRNINRELTWEITDNCYHVNARYSYIGQEGVAGTRDRILSHTSYGFDLQKINTKGFHFHLYFSERGIFRRNCL